MENTVIDFLQLTETSDMTFGNKNNKSYVSYIKINGKPILPPLIDEEKRKELQKYKEKAIETELKLAKLKKINKSKIEQSQSQISGEFSCISNIPLSRQSTPARPATLNLTEKRGGKSFILTNSKTEGYSDKSKNNSSLNDGSISSQQSDKTLGRPFKSTLEHRLASENGIIVRNKLNICQQSPITEEQFPNKCVESEDESRSEKKRWSPLQIDSINSLKIELPTKEPHDGEKNVEIPLDDSLHTPDTVTHSPSLMRQNSYTLLTPSPALLQFLETQKDSESIPRSHSGRKTWDLSKAKKNWDPKNGSLGKSSDEEDYNDECVQFLNKKNSSSLDSFSAVQNSQYNDPGYQEDSVPNSLAYDSGTSPDSYNSKKNVSKVKCKLKGKRVRSTKSVPSPGSADKVPFKDLPTQGSLNDFSKVAASGTEISDLSSLLLKMKVDFERQKKELEEKQQSEMKKLKIIFQRKEAELLSKVTQLPRKTMSKSIYSQSSRQSWHQDMGEADLRMMGDGNFRKGSSGGEHYQSRRPHSAKDFHSQFYYGNDCNRRARSMDFNQGNQDTDLDISFQDDFMHSKDTTLNNEYMIESDSVSNFSSHSSTVSSDIRQDLPSMGLSKKFQGISSEEYAKYNRAASKITAAVRGYLTRRLLRTAHVQGLIVTLKDAITCATQLHTASDIADSDIDLMRRLSRQIEAAWDAVYAVFFNTETSTKLQLIANDRERLKMATAKTPANTAKKKRISSATKKSLDRKKGVMSKSQTSNGFSRVRICTKMAASYPSPYFPQKLK